MEEQTGLCVCLPFTISEEEFRILSRIHRIFRLYMDPKACVGDPSQICEFIHNAPGIAYLRSDDRLTLAALPADRCYRLLVYVYDPSQKTKILGRIVHVDPLKGTSVLWSHEAYSAGDLNRIPFSPTEQ